MTSKYDEEILELKSTIAKTRTILISAEKKAKNAGVTLNGLSDIITKLQEFEMRLDFRQSKPG